MIENLHFLRPDWFYAFIPLALLLYFARHQSVHSISWKKICDAQLFPFILIGNTTKTSRLPFIVTAITITLCIVAAAGPVWKKLPTPVFRDQSSLVIAMDLSRSMDASDIKPSRLIRAKLKVFDILQQRKGGQTALIVYAANAFTVTPLTTDTSTIANLVSALDTTMMPAQGSNVVDALKLARSLLGQSGETRGDVLLITDGFERQDFHAITDLTDNGHRLSILGVGTRDGGPIALDGGFLQDNNGAIVITRLDTAVLHEAAFTGHGLFVSIQSNDDDINALTTLFSRNQTKSESVELSITADLWHEEGPLLLLIVLPLVALLSRRGLLVLTAVLLIPAPEPAYALDMDSLWLNSDQRAMSYFEKGEHETAAELFEQDNWKASAYYRHGEYEKTIASLEHSGEVLDSDDLYNKANALARLGRYQESITAYDEAINLNQDNQDAIFNRDLVKKKLQTQQTQQDQGKQDEKQPEKDDQKQSDEKDEKSEDENSSDGQQADEQSENGDQDKLSEQSAEKQDEKDSQDPSSTPENKNEDQASEDKENLAANLEQKDLSESNEQRKATEQWLKRIVDDPGGLLRRKFKYQYKNMPGQKQSRQPW